MTFCFYRAIEEYNAFNNRSQYGAPKIVNSDQESRFTSQEWIPILQESYLKNRERKKKTVKLRSYKPAPNHPWHTWQENPKMACLGVALGGEDGTFLLCAKGDIFILR